MRHLAGVALLLWAATAAAAEEVLRVGMDTRTPPWSYIPGVDYSKEDSAKSPQVNDVQVGRMEGMEVDVAVRLAQHLSAKLRIVPAAWFELETGLLAKRYDAIINGWTPSSKTPPAIFASAPYYDWGLLIAVRSDDKTVRAYADLAGMTIGHYRDPVAERTLASLRPGKLVSFDSQEALFDELRAGSIRAVLFDSLYVRWRISRDPAFRAVGEPLNRLGYHVGVRRDDLVLCRNIQAAVEWLVSSGEIAKIRQKWEGAPRP
jgi:ABC-type amino acid transport substrate-binding protein